MIDDQDLARLKVEAFDIRAKIDMIEAKISPLRKDQQEFVNKYNNINSRINAIIKQLKEEEKEEKKEE